MFTYLLTYSKVWEQKVKEMKNGYKLQAYPIKFKKEKERKRKREQNKINLNGQDKTKRFHYFSRVNAFNCLLFLVLSLSKV